MKTSFDHLSGSEEAILNEIESHFPEVRQVLARARDSVVQSKREVLPYQAAILYAFANMYDRPGAAILEIGTAYGYSCSVMAQGARVAKIVTLNPKEKEFPHAQKSLSIYPNVRSVQETSWGFFKPADRFDFIFVDGDHGQVERDLVYWNNVKPGGLMIFHDYAPEGTWRPCQPVFEAVNNFGAGLGLEVPDVLIVDDKGIGMAGFYKPESESV